MGKLTDRTIRNLETPCRHTDGDTLYLVVSPSGDKNWVQRLVIQGQRHDLGLGPYPAVALALARQNSQENRSLVKSGGNPMAVKREAEALAKTPSFEAMARRHIARTPTPGEMPSTGHNGSLPLPPTPFPLSAPLGWIRSLAGTLSRPSPTSEPPIVPTPKTGPAGVLVLWGDHTLEGGAFHEEFPVHGGADRPCAQAG